MTHPDASSSPATSTAPCPRGAGGRRRAPRRVRAAARRGDRASRPSARAALDGPSRGRRRPRTSRAPAVQRSDGMRRGTAARAPRAGTGRGLRGGGRRAALAGPHAGPARTSAGRRLARCRPASAQPRPRRPRRRQVRSACARGLESSTRTTTNTSLTASTARFAAEALVRQVARRHPPAPAVAPTVGSRRRLNEASACIVQGVPQVPGTPRAPHPGRFEGTPAYLGALHRGPGAGQPADAADRAGSRAVDGCREPLSSTSRSCSPTLLSRRPPGGNRRAFSACGRIERHERRHPQRDHHRIGAGRLHGGPLRRARQPRAARPEGPRGRRAAHAHDRRRELPRASPTASWAPS